MCPITKESIEHFEEYVKRYELVYSREIKRFYTV